MMTPPWLRALAISSAAASAAAMLLACAPSATAPVAAPPSTAAEQPPASNASELDDAARTFVLLVLALGQHDEDYVDAYYGPQEWKQEATAHPRSVPDLEKEANALLQQVQSLRAASDSLLLRRQRFLEKQLGAVIARTAMLQGRTMPFDVESQLLYDAVAPVPSAEDTQRTLAELGQLLPGEGPLSSRYEAYMELLVVPQDKIESILRLGLDACKQRTTPHIALPADERFDLELVRNVSWGGYNRYFGGYRSLIQVNIDLPVRIGRALSLGCHEAYPGHHVLNVLIERHLVRERGWMEFTVYPLFSPQSLIAEGTANYGVELAFPEDDRIAFYRSKLFPQAGLDPAEAERYRRVEKLTHHLGYVENDLARRFLQAELDETATVEALSSQALKPRAFAQRSIRFFGQYRSYVINYTVGEDLVRDFVENKASTPEDKWALFATLLREPTLPSDVRVTPR